MSRHVLELGACSMLLILVLLGGLVAVVAGEALAQLGARRTRQAALQFTGPVADVLSAPPAGPPHAADGPVLVERRPRPSLRRRPTASLPLFVVTFVFYAAVGGVLVLHYGSSIGDAYSRLSDAYYVFYSRDPHLAAVGFVWSPLPSILVMPAFLFRSLWPALTKQAFAMSLESAAFMAACVVQLRLMFRELEVRRSSANVLLAAFALNPMIVYYAANGMSEAPYLFFLIVAVRYLALWLRSNELRPLVFSGVAMGFCYLVRYEVAAAAPFAAALVLGVTFCRSDGPRKKRLQTGLADAVVFSIPFAAAFIGWAVLTFVITGHPFDQFSSQYGNTAQIQAGGSTPTSVAGIPDALFAIIQVLALAPILPAVFGGALYRSWKRRDPRVLALFIFVAVLAFSFFEFVTGGTFPWLRYYLPAVPLAVLSVAMLINRRGRGVPRRGPRMQRILQSVVAATLVAVVVAPTIATTAWAMSDTNLGASEHQRLAWVVNGHATGTDERASQAFFPSVNSITSNIDARSLPSGSVLADTFNACMWAVVVVTRHPHQFVITSDRDFQPAVSDPYTFHVRYVIVPPPGGGGSLDQINRQYPSLYKTGAGFAHEIKQYNTLGCPTFRLFRVDHSPGATP